MSIKTEFKALLKKLSQDPKLREAIQSMTENSDRNFAALSKGLATTLLLAGRFVGKGRIKTFISFIDAAVFLISLSLMIKQNVFDKPEVRDFVKKVWKDIGKTANQLATVARNYVDKRLPKSRSRAV